MQKRSQVVMGDTGSGGGVAYIDQRILQKIFDVKLKQVLGYPGGAGKRPAVERGELDGDCGGWTGIPADWLRDKKINIFIRFQEHDPRGVAQGGSFTGDLVKNPDHKKLLDLIVAPSDFGRPFIMSKESPGR